VRSDPRGGELEKSRRNRTCNCTREVLTVVSYGIRSAKWTRERPSLALRLVQTKASANFTKQNAASLNDRCQYP
jgi:hypothetical protein